MITWKEARRVISKTLGKELGKCGFVNPGYIMYRYRREFIDIVQCYFPNHCGYFYVDLGCQPRGIRIKNNFRTWESLFCGRVWKNNNVVLTVDLFNTVEEEETYINDMLPLIIPKISNWFSNFVSIDSAINALESNDIYGMGDRVTFAGKGSMVYNEALSKLVSLKSMKLVQGFGEVNNAKTN